jgi:hypothetical protein
MDPHIDRMDPHIDRMNPHTYCMNPHINRMNPHINRINPYMNKNHIFWTAWLSDNGLHTAYAYAVHAAAFNSNIAVNWEIEEPHGFIELAMNLVQQPLTKPTFFPFYLAIKKLLNEWGKLFCILWVLRRLSQCCDFLILYFLSFKNIKNCSIVIFSRL